MNVALAKQVAQFDTHFEEGALQTFFDSFALEGEDIPFWLINQVELVIRGERNSCLHNNTYHLVDHLIKTKLIRVIQGTDCELLELPIGPEAAAKQTSWWLKQVVKRADVEVHAGNFIVLDNRVFEVTSVAKFGNTTDTFREV